MSGKEKGICGGDCGSEGRSGHGGGQRFWRCVICRGSAHVTIECDKFRCHECGDQREHQYLLMANRQVYLDLSGVGRWTTQSFPIYQRPLLSST